jgi:hypothetical protein
MPIPLDVCPTCHHGIKQARGWTWIDPLPFLRQCVRGTSNCPLNDDALSQRCGLIWIGAEFYPTPADFLREAHRLGVSRRIKAVPKDFVLGETWVWLAHSKAIMNPPTSDATDLPTWTPGVFHIFRPTHLEQIVTESQTGDDDLMASLEKRQITPIVVPDDDPDHARPIRGKRQLTLNLEANP